MSPSSIFSGLMKLRRSWLRCKNYRFFSVEGISDYSLRAPHQNFRIALNGRCRARVVNNLGLYDLIKPFVASHLKVFRNFATREKPTITLPPIVTDNPDSIIPSLVDNHIPIEIPPHRIDKPVTIIAGASRGLGFEFTRQILAKHLEGPVFAACRNPDGADNLSSLKGQYPSRLKIRKLIEGILPDEITHIYILKACSLIGAIDKGEEIYKRMCKGSLELNINVGIAMLDMYAKNGLVAKAKDIFYKLPLKEIVAWNALITAYALLGKTKQVSFSFAQMMRNGNRPNKVTFASVLSSYNHEGQVNEGKSQFEAMTTMYGIIPEVEHYTCMIDLLSRAGQLEEAVVVANQMPFQSNLFVWHTLLSSARQWGNIDLGIYAFDNVLKLDVEDVSALTCMAYIYSDVTSIEDT